MFFVHGNREIFQAYVSTMGDEVVEERGCSALGIVFKIRAVGD